MILRKANWLLLLATFSTIHLAQSQGERAYDTSEWIPITPHPLQAAGSEPVESHAPHDRVLTLDPSAKNFFPDYEYRQRQPNQILPLSPKKIFDPRPRKLMFPTDYSYETPPPPPQKSQINYYDRETPYLYRAKQQRPAAERYVGVPSVNPQAPKPDAPDLYEQYQLPFNSSFYQSLSPSSINNDFYQAIRSNGGEVARNASERQAPRLQNEQESVQLVYVPVENLKPQSTEGTLRERLSLPAYSPVVSPYEPPQEDPAGGKQSRLESIRQDYLQQSLRAERLQEQLGDDINPLNQIQTSTTSRPSKKPHQPPLAVFLESQQKAEIGDVLNILKGAKTIAVQDKVTPESPQIFIGPSNLDSPDGYTKFPLPYLNNINGNRIERKIDQLPFFVAPIGYKTPPGYAKISLPSPHVGSVVVSVPPSLDSVQPNQVFRTQESIPDSYDLLNPGGGEYQSSLDSFRGQYQSTLDSVRGQYQSTQSPSGLEYQGLGGSTPARKYPPERNPFGPAYTSAAPTPYYTEPTNREPRPSVYSPPQIYEQQPPTQKPPPKPSTQLPEVSNIDLAIDEYEMSQINNDFEEHNKVKHSTSRRPPPEAPPTTRRPSGRSRFETEPSRTRTRGRGGVSRTSSSTTPAPVEPDRYTVLEEFSTETYRSPSSTERPTSTFSGNRYLPEEAFDTARGQYAHAPKVPEVEKKESFEGPPKQYFTEVENIPANVYNLGQPESYEAPRIPASSIRPSSYENLEVNTQPPLHRFSPDVISYENREPNQGRTSVGGAPREPPSDREPVGVQSVQRGEEPFDNLFQPNFDQTYSTLQDQAVRSLLVPNLLAPGTKQQHPATESFPLEDQTEAFVGTEAATTSTTTPKPTVRSRGRGRTRPTAVVESAPPRRAPSRRRPVASTERTIEYGSKEDSGGSGSNVQQQRFRTRARPSQNDIVDRPSTTTNTIYPEPKISSSLPPIEVVTAAPYQEPEIQDFERVYSVPLPQSTPATQPVVLEYDNTRVRTTAAPETNERRLETNRESDEEIYRRPSNANIKSGGVLYNRREPSTSTAAPTRARGRTRGRSRFATTTSTSRPAVRASSRPTSATLRPSVAEQEEPEFFGFIRQPSFAPLPVTTTTVEPSVRFVGEIRPKYTPRTTTAPPSEDVDYPETPRTRVRTRTRPPARQAPNSVRGGENEAEVRSGEQGNRRTVTPQRTRGRSHYRAPDNVKRENDDEDVANQNYPTQFLQRLEVSSAKPRKTFQISVDPLEGDEDQASYSSIHRPKFVQAPHDVDDTRNLNGLQNSEKSEDLQSSSSEPQALAFELTSHASLPEEVDSSQAASSVSAEEPAVKTKRRGAWKLVRQRPADPLEVSESQNYQSVLNAFGSIEKTGPLSKPAENFDEDLESVGAATENHHVAEMSTTVKPPETIFDKIYEMFGVFGQAETNSTSTEDANTVTNPVFPEEITEVPTTTMAEEPKALETTESAAVGNISTSTQPYDVEPWEMKQVKTSTSTEISHETEICYKGRCVKSRDEEERK